MSGLEELERVVQKAYDDLEASSLTKGGDYNLALKWVLGKIQEAKEWAKN